jgi:hypothetical protein
MLGTTAVGLIAAACGVNRSEVASTQPAITVTTSTPPPTPSTSTTSTSTTIAAAPATTTTGAPQAATTIEVICKEAWGAQSVAGEFRDHQIDQITVHHTAVLLEANKDAPARARRHQAYHQSLGWPDLAYHYLIDAAGNVYEGRPVSAVGDTATDYDPTGHLLICCEGDFSRQEVPAAQYESLVAMLAWGAAEFGVDPETIRGHRDLASTTCPGDALYAPLADGTLYAQVAEAMRRGVLQLEMVCGSEGSARIGSIEAGTG